MSTPAGALPDNTAFAAASERSIDELLRLPLTLAATVLWLWGTFRVGSMWFLQEPTVAWIAAAGLSTVAGALLVGYVGGGWPRALGIPLLLGLWTLSGAAIVAGVGWPGLTVIATIYALATWSVGRWLLNHPLCQHVAGLLFGREVDAGVVERVEPRLRWWSIAISMGALALAVLNHAGLLLTPYAPLTELLGALLVTAGLLLWIGIATRQRTPVYLLVAVLGQGVVLWFASTREPAAANWLALMLMPAFAHTLLAFAASLMIAARLTQSDGPVFGPVLGASARWITFAVLALGFPYLPVVVVGGNAPTAFGILAASAMLMLTGSGQVPLNRAAALLTVALGAAATHGLVIGLLDVGSSLEWSLLTHTTVAIALAVTMATLAYGLDRYRQSILADSLRTVSSLLYAATVLALLGLVPTGLSADGWLWPLALGIALLGLFPVLAPLEEAGTLRGIAFPVFATGLYHSVVGGSVLDPSYALWTAGWGFTLLAVTGGLTRWNRNWPEWAVDPRTSAVLAPAFALVAGLLLAWALTTNPAQSWFPLAALVIACGGLGWWSAQRRWLALSMFLLILLESVLALRLAEPGMAQSAHAYAALAMSLTLALATWGLARSEARLAWDPDNGRFIAVGSVLAGSCQFSSVLAVGYLAWHTGWTILAGRFGEASGSAVGAAGFAGALLIALAVRLAHRRVQSRWIYACAALGLLCALYLRVSLVAAPLWTATDTTVLVAAAFVLYAVQRVTRTTATLHLVLILPLIALTTLPFELGSVRAGNALVSVAVLYLLIRGATGSRLALYLGVLCLNAALFFWIPLWATEFALLQLYVLPVAASVLGLLHLHRDELSAGTLNACRLAAASALYAGAGLDVFLHPGLGLGPFALALLLALVGVGLGIGLRIRAFLYTGVAFLILTVGSQLWQLYPDNRLGRAVLLLVLGTAITGAMIAFNVKREAIMARVRIARADLVAWE